MHDTRARVTGPNEVTLDTGEVITAGHILVATGGHPVRPDMPNAALGMVSDDIFNLEALPKSVLIVARGLIAEMMREQGIDLHVGTNIVDMWPAEDGSDDDADMGAPAVEGHADTATGPGPVIVKATNGSERRYDRLFFATGRAPNSHGIGLEEVGVKLNRRGAIEVDDYSQTAVPSIYAIGDVTDRIQLTPVAIREGMAFTETVFRDNPTAVDHANVPSAVFTQPELGTIGLSEEAARDQEEIEVYCTSFRPMRTAFAGHPHRVLFKLIVSKATRKVLGCHIVADAAGELIQMVGIAVKAGLTKEDFDRTVAVHPTMSEELVTMRQPVRTA